MAKGSDDPNRGDGMIGLATPVLVAGDGIGNDILGMADALVSVGVEVRLYAYRNSTDRSVDRLTPNLVREPLVALIYHHSCGCPDVEPAFTASRYPCVMKYHNITPPSFFPPGSPENTSCMIGVGQTERLAQWATVVWADSEFNAAELPVTAEVLPPFHQADDLLRRSIDPTIAVVFDPWIPVWLSVGTLLPHKSAAEIVDALAEYRRAYGPARLVLAGDATRPYAAEVQAAATRHGFNSSDVTILGRVSPDQLATLYRLADVFVLASQHEGFSVPVVEAFAFGVPAVVRGGTAAPATSGNAARVYTGGPVELAAAVQAALDNRPRLVAAGKVRYRDLFHPARIHERFLTLLQRVTPMEKSA